MRGGAVAVSAVAFAWVVVRAQVGCGTEAALSEPDEPADVSAPELKVEPEPEEPAPVIRAQPDLPRQAAEPPGNPPSRGNDADEKPFFPASKSGLVDGRGGLGDLGGLREAKPPPAQEQAKPRP